MSWSISRQLSHVFEYPAAEYVSSVKQVATGMSSKHPAVAEQLGQLASLLLGKSPGELSELYTVTFDLSPLCAPYLSVHLFGEESFKRATLMTGLAETYANIGLDCHGELPDHLSLVLSALELVDDDMRRELVNLCLKPALVKMEPELRRQESPYLHAVLAVEAWLDAAELEGEVKCA